MNTLDGYDLTNLNNERSNEPGIDLGDTRNKIAYQFTSSKNSQKIKKTLEAITDEQKKTYDTFKILIVGEKANPTTLQIR
jgi:hypothetical protein